MLLATLTALVLLPGAEIPPKKMEWTIGDANREALVSAPAQDSKSSPVVFAFHGHGGNAAQAARSFGYHKIWPEAIVVYMQGLPTPGKLTDPEGKKNGWQSSAGDQGDRDLKFFDAVLKTLKKDYAVDENRIYSTGHSNGGGFTYTLWAERGDVFAAMAPSAAGPGSDFKNLKPKPAMHVAGEKDPLVKYEWQTGTMERVRKLNGCEATGKEWATSGKFVGTEYPSKSGTPFVSLIYPGTHTFPDEAPKLIVKFFQQHEKDAKK